jgi:uncharacterized protein (DUF2336 family)
METPSLRSLEGLTSLGLRGGIDMRPTLIRVLTDLYVQKPTHSAEEDRYYTELALRLLDSVDVATRAAVASRLGQHLAPPRRVIERLAGDLPEVRAALLQHAAAAMAGTATELARKAPTAPSGEPASLPKNVETASERVGAEIAGELNELFFAATADERRLILLNLHIVAAPPATPPHLASDAAIGRRLEAAALARRREEFVQVLAQSLRISREQARRIAGDELGEPIVIAAKALAIPRDVLYRILLFVNTAVGHSVERVHALAGLYDEMTVQAAHDLVTTWQALPAEARGGAGPQRHAAMDRLGAREAASVRRMPVLPLRSVRREAS